MIDISVIVVTLNEEKNLRRCLRALEDFDDVIVVDSGSQDDTIAIAKSYGAKVENFNWNGEYPKKRQWCLDNIDIKNDFVFFIDADEVVTPKLVTEIKALDRHAAGYFVKGRYVWYGQPLRYGLQNNKLALINRHKMYFPTVDDIAFDSMGEVEGHYQPVLIHQKNYNICDLESCGCEEIIGQVRAPLLHYAYEDKQGWSQRHKNYAQWEAQMIIHNAYPKDPVGWRQAVKQIYRRVLFRGTLAFLHSYIIRLGFLDGVAGYEFSISRKSYYDLVNDALATNKPQEKFSAWCKARFAR